MFLKAGKRRHTLFAQVREVVDDLPLLVDLPAPLAHEYEQTYANQVQCTEDTISRLTTSKLHRSMFVLQDVRAHGLCWPKTHRVALKCSPQSTEKRGHQSVTRTVTWTAQYGVPLVLLVCMHIYGFGVYWLTFRVYMYAARFAGECIPRRAASTTTPAAMPMIAPTGKELPPDFVLAPAEFPVAVPAAYGGAAV